MCYMKTAICHVLYKSYTTGLSSYYTEILSSIAKKQISLIGRRWEALSVLGRAAYFADEQT